ncbi:c-type cytochrome biogenesis protein CcsB [Curtobacterium pusillum]|uniref:C-type cytochrome biogenesis protein CcsB n=2 Tax=Microbacteriaceae TaxID=85023 RepID=A0AAW3TDQ8_9MICO|nr:MULTISPECIES: c-type cytochrome biogenesis protein CcsB [Curtobacterium]MBA8992127.1 cytochrome c-type biogenesis protein CcsB [Curtobacterium pusillum]NUU13467.1 c-type cytochrome biogenesis protein CcsB [Curtobacterium pusillum]PZE85361.1 c-type cytochrome biogenesis protein CcsB [Curtobacterium sp. MCLR17_039]GLK32340.1 c-type cytochrome biogenesis protein CcsB [Curtobacterium pusillum]
MNMTTNLATYSVVLTYSAMAVYVVAFIAFALDMAKRSGEVAAASSGAGAPKAAAEQKTVATVQGGTVVLERVAQSSDGDGSSRRGTRFERVGMAMTVLALVLHVGSVVLRGIAADRVPWGNMFEFSLTGTALIILIFLLVQLWQNLKFLGVFITGLTIILLGIATVNYYVPVRPLVPALESYWLVIHVFVAIAGTGFFALGAGLAVAQLVQTYHQGRTTSNKIRFMETLPDADRLEVLTYRVLLVGFVLWTFTLIAGAIWAERAWGRYWGWDTKEVWTFIIWVVYAGYIHARATRGWRGARSSWLALIGFAAVMFNFSVVNVFFKGLHSYSGI